MLNRRCSQFIVHDPWRALGDFGRLKLTLYRTDEILEARKRLCFQRSMRTNFSFGRSRTSSPLNNFQMRLVADKQDLSSFYQDLKIQPKRSVANVIFIKGVLFFRRDKISAVDLSPTGYPGQYGKSYPNARRLIDWEQRTRPYDRHFPTQYIEELWNLVQPHASQESPKARNSPGFILMMAMSIKWSQ